GYTDVIQFYQNGVENVVSSSGTALTSEQIRLIRRLTKNITVLFDGDQAGIRASIRGVDLILEQGMNVKICTFPEGEDPDRFAKSHSEVELKHFLEENATDFIQFKGSLLAKERQNDPIKKDETIRDITKSISQIPDRIQQEVYIQECARIMDISEDVLYSTLAQMGRKEIADAQRDYRKKRQEETMNVVKTPQGGVGQRVNLIDELEKNIIAILLFYGAQQERFKDTILQENENGEVVEQEVQLDQKVYEKIFLELQADEIEFTNEAFHEIYTNLIDIYNREGEVQVDKFQQLLTQEQSQLVVDILMNEEKYSLSNWESKDILVKTKEMSVGLLVFQTIAMLRLKLLNNLVDQVHDEIGANNNATPQQLEDIKNYWELRKMLSYKFGLVTNTTFHS